MIKIVTDEPLEEMSCWVTPDGQDAPCSNCRDVKAAVKRGDVKGFCYHTNYQEGDADAEMKKCKSCIWHWIDEVEEV